MPENLRSPHLRRESSRTPERRTESRRVVPKDGRRRIESNGSETTGYARDILPSGCGTEDLFPLRLTGPGCPEDVT